MQQLRLLSTTGLLTLFIWVSADQLLQETADLPVSITVQAEPNSDMVVNAAPGAPETFTVTVSGRQTDVAALREHGIGPIVLTIKEGPSQGRDLGKLNLSLGDELRANTSAFGGCVVQNVSPATMPVIIDRRVDITLPVRVQPGGLDYAVEPQVDPETVQATILQSTYDRVHAANPHITLDAELYLKNQPEEQAVKLQVPLPPVAVSDTESLTPFRISPDTVTLRATLRQRLKRGTIPAVPIKFLVSPNVHRRFDIEYREENPPETLRIDVVGPPQIIDKLVSGERKTFAVIALKSPDPIAEAPYEFFEPQFRLPPGVELAENQSVPTFEIKLVPRDQTPR
ncbi:MAG: hypothetical protein V3W34_13060 [Phycisphaerae bacterium]